MKRILILLVTIIFASSCSNAPASDEVTMSKSEYKKLKGLDSTYPKQFNFLNEAYDMTDRGLLEFSIILGEDNHEYLANSGYNAYVLTHYPECKLCIQRYINLMKRLETIEKNQENVK